MEIKVKLRNFRASPRKVRKVVDLIRGKGVLQAINILSFTPNKSSKPILKLLMSGIDAAKKNYKAEEKNLYISKITVDEGPKFKRWFPMSRGRAYPIMKRTSHITVVLSEAQKDNKQEQENNNKQEKNNKDKENKRKTNVKKKSK